MKERAVSERAKPERAERGTAAVLVVALVGLLLLVGLAAAFVTATVAAHRRAQAAADLAALAGAGVASGVGADSCRAAADVAALNHARLTACTRDGADLVVEVAVDGPRMGGHGWVLRGRARAGPGPP